MRFSRYDIHWVSLDPSQGSELRKTRPAVIVSLDVLNRVLETVVICPLTSHVHEGWRSRLAIRLTGKAAEIAADQIRTVSKSRLRRKIGRLSAANAASLRRLLTEMYGTG